MKIFRTIMIYTLIALGLFSCNEPTANEKPNSQQTLYFGGDILTMEGEQPSYVEALVAEDGKIVYTGALADAESNFSQAKKVDLEGTSLLPGFIDAHGHLWGSGFQSLSANLLAPPDGEGTDIEALIQITQQWMETNLKAIGQSGWIVGFGYDDAQLEEKRHPTADELDQISTEYPVIFVHQSGHLGVMNHKALEMAQYTADTPNPPGGVIRRVEGSNEPNGVLEEMGLFIPLFGLMASFDEKANEAIAKAGIKVYSSFGYTTAQEGRATRENAETWLAMAEANELFLDVAVYPDIQKELPFILENGVSPDYQNHVRIAGVKISLDGSPQGKTAWLTQAYVVPPPGQSKDYKGYPAFPEEENVIALVDSAYKHQWQILAHTNGDAASDQYIRAIRHAYDHYPYEDPRSVMIHAQTVREDQLDSMKLLNIIPSFFGMHTFYWGDWHRDETLGKERAFRISPAQSALKRGMKFTQHHDAPVALPSSIMILHAVINRVSRSGDTIGEDQKVSPYIALKALTDWAAYQYFEEDTKGTLKVGKLADFVVLDKNPLKVPPLEIMNIKVLKTIKEDSLIYQRK